MLLRFAPLFLVACAGRIDGSSLCATADAGSTPGMPEAAVVPQTSPVQNPPPDATPKPECTTSAECDGQLCVGGKCSPCTGPYTECFDDPSYGSAFFCFSGRCRSVFCSNENSPCGQIPGRECCNLGDGTLACVEGECCNDAQCSAPETCQNHRCQ